MSVSGRLGRAVAIAAPAIALVLVASSPAWSQAIAPAAGATAPRATTVDVASTQSSAPRPEGGGVAATTIDKIKQAATKAADIFHRVPCLSPKGAPTSMGTLPHVATKLAEHRPIKIIAFGSSSTEGYGSTAPEFTYPSRLAAQLHRHYPDANITVINRGRGGEDAPEMMARLKKAVIDEKPDLVIWQVGTNAILRNLDPDKTTAEVEDGIARIQAAGSDIVLVDPQYVPAVNRKGENANRMVKLLNKVAGQHHIGIFPRFAVMRDWHEKQALAFDSFSIADGLHMNDWGYACFAQLLGDDIIRSVGQIKLGVTVPSEVLTYRPL